MIAVVADRPTSQPARSSGRRAGRGRGAPVTCVWENEVGGLTFAVHGPAGAGDTGDRPELYVEWAPAQSGRWSAHVDFECLGVADRWADLAIASWSCDWNFGPGWQDELLAAYGVEPDPERTSYYRLLWDLA